ncbi:uncharacterized protein CIMG_13239 [Coccidioides immitis RS]|uniref:Uncharacterized protein n=1 Tax=Coccidioides immitis (strain RS) TaxID=246410 RepID=J3K590_COCIM|nr:uncharacterized protein CIMG_13239 [Coccidioides immitis RS]EAS29571.3 hypothetical protein CIMG_13239 [Coccidioides immitis RS]
MVLIYLGQNKPDAAFYCCILEAKVMTHGHDYLAAVSVSRERVEKKMRGFLGQLQGLSEDNNSPPVPEKVEKNNFEVVMFSDKNDEKDNEAEDDWIINI